MTILNPTKTSRRRFLTRAIPACALTCGFGNGLFGMIPETTTQDKHMFDREFSRKITWRQYINATNALYIDFAKRVQKKMGEDATLELIRTMTTEYNLEKGRKQAEKSKDRSLHTYTRMFADPKKWEGILRMEVVEDTETAFELKVTECLQAYDYRHQDAAEIGHASICWGDYAWAEGFNPKIKLVRDKTLMQGHDCCNHRYIWAG